MKKHVWVCDGGYENSCGHAVEFRQPELPEDDPDSETNESKVCPNCGENMYYREADGPTSNSAPMETR